MRALLLTFGLCSISIGVAAQCPSDLSHLDARLPRYDQPNLIEVRNAIIKENLDTAFEKMRAAGMSPAQAASDALKSSDAAEQQRIVAQQCIRDVSTDPDKVISALEQGSYEFGRGSIQESCAIGYVTMFYASVAMKEVALGVACRARQ